MDYNFAGLSKSEGAKPEFNFAGLKPVADRSWTPEGLNEEIARTMFGTKPTSEGLRFNGLQQSSPTPSVDVRSDAIDEFSRLAPPTEPTPDASFGEAMQPVFTGLKKASGVLEETIMPPIEAAESLISGVASFPISRSAKIIALSRGKSEEEAEQLEQDIAQRLTFAPKTPGGKKAAEILGTLVSIPAEIGRELAMMPAESWGLEGVGKEVALTAGELATYAKTGHLSKQGINYLKSRKVKIPKEVERTAVEKPVEPPKSPVEEIKPEPIQPITEAEKVAPGAISEGVGATEVVSVDMLETKKMQGFEDTKGLTRWVINVDGKEVGTIDGARGIHNPDTLYIRNIEIDEPYQRRGIGTRFVNQLHEKLGTRDVRTTTDTTIAGKKFFKSLQTKGEKLTPAQERLAELDKYQINEPLFERLPKDEKIRILNEKKAALDLRKQELAQAKEPPVEVKGNLLEEAKKYKTAPEGGYSLGFGPTDYLQKAYDTVTSTRKEAEASIEPPMTSAVKNVIDALGEAKKARKEQERSYTKERGERLGKITEIGQKVKGERGYYEKLGALKGEFTKVEFETLRNKVTQKDIDTLFTQIQDSPIISEWEKLPAGSGLAKLLGEEGGRVPTKNEIALLKEVFGSQFVSAMTKHQSMWSKAKEIGYEIANIPRSIMASFDLSAPLRQGLFMIGRPKQWVPAFGQMFKYFASEKAYNDLMQNIRSRPTYAIMKDSGLSLTELGKMTMREERFMSNYAEKIPIIGRGVRASSRAYTGFLDKLRADIFDDLLKKGEKVGANSKKFRDDLASFINHGTGRGGLGGLENSAVALNTFFFSPRLLASRLQLLNPVYYIKLEPFVRKEALKSLFTFAATATTVATIAKLNGADVGTDPRNADFMKLKFGNTRYDFLGGFQQPVRLGAQLISGKIISSTTGKEITLGEGYKPITRLGIIGRFLEYKEAPLVSFATSLLKGQSTLGEKLDIPTEIANRFIPMVMQDMMDVYDEEGKEGIPLAVPAIFGVGLQTYGGVQSYGLKGSDYPKLNQELARLKIGMGFPSTSAFGQELTLNEYKMFKERSGREIANRLSKVINSTQYDKWSDNRKRAFIEDTVDSTKTMLKHKIFREKERAAAKRRAEERAKKYK